MKKILFMLPLFFTVVWFSCNSPKPKESTEIQTVINKAVAEIHVEGMTCTGCENTVNKSVGSLDGVVEVSSSHADKKTLVTYDADKTSLDEIKGAIEKVGYQVVEEQTIE